MKWFIQYFVFLSEIWINFFLIEVPILARFKATLKGPLSLQDDETAHQIVAHIFNIWKVVRKTPTFFVGDLLDEEKFFKDWFNLAMEQLKASTVKAHMTSLGDFLAFCVRQTSQLKESQSTCIAWFRCWEMPGRACAKKLRNTEQKWRQMR